MARERNPGSGVLLTDNQAVVRNLEGRRPGRNKEVEELKRELRELGEGRRVRVQWVPAHVGIEGNEWADREANEARREEQEGVGIWFEAAKRRVRRHCRLWVRG